MLMITDGQKVPDISEKLCLSPKTVNSYRYRLFEKLKIKNDVELTHLAIRYGIHDHFAKHPRKSDVSSTSFDYKSFLKTLPSLPGIYQMFDIRHTLIYVGKAQNLKKRVSSYFQKNLKSIKTENLVRQIHQIEIIITKTNAEALLLEK